MKRPRPRLVFRFLALRTLDSEYVWIGTVYSEKIDENRVHCGLVAERFIWETLRGGTERCYDLDRWSYLQALFVCYDVFAFKYNDQKSVFLH